MIYVQLGISKQGRIYVPVFAKNIHFERIHLHGKIAFSVTSDNLEAGVEKTIFPGF